MSEAGAAALAGSRVLDLSRLLPGLALARTPSELEPLTILPRAWILNNRPADRVFWVLLRRSWSRWVAALAVVRPDPSPPGWYGPPAGGTSRATRAGRSL